MPAPKEPKKKRAAAKRAIKKLGAAVEAHLTAGRPVEYDPQYAISVLDLALLGLTNEEMATVFHITPETFKSWCDKHPKFLRAIAEGRHEADGRVAKSLFKRALGYSHDDEHISVYDGVVTRTKITKHFPPDTNAASLWLRNRQPRRWRDRVEHTGQEGGPIVIITGVDRGEPNPD